MITGAIIFFVGCVVGGLVFRPSTSFIGNYQKTPKWVNMVLKDKQATIVDMTEPLDIL